MPEAQHSGNPDVVTQELPLNEKQTDSDAITLHATNDDVWQAATEANTGGTSLQGSNESNEAPHSEEAGAPAKEQSKFVPRDIVC